jgi:hypothetical protein
MDARRLLDTPISSRLLPQYTSNNGGEANTIRRRNAGVHTWNAQNHQNYSNTSNNGGKRPILEVRMAAPQLGIPKIIKITPILPIMAARHIVGGPKIIIKTPMLSIMAARPILDLRMVTQQTIGKPKCIIKSPILPARPGKSLAARARSRLGLQSRII